ncbi:phenylalanyl-tRNA synthetase [Theileria orientalis]|uniref:phenylalanine--tRNA ligase n=1 Tax=Theileria orientalis TaxID=68886 RepID=A0A976M7C4_THEOR|nr:phenylalanyl-tRNA synthetase [Theileria orientalis]
MPTVAVLKDEFFKQLGHQLSLEDLESLFFEFGLEYDGAEIDEKGRDIIKIEIPANRYDLLSLEGLVTALLCFRWDVQLPEITLVPPIPPNLSRINVQKENSAIRPYIFSAILRGVVLDENRYKSLIDVQEKLHQNLCRKRTIAAIGTHDLDTVSPPFTYTFERPEDIVFSPLTDSSREYNALELMEVYESHQQLKNYSKLLKGQPFYPVVRDSSGHVCSLPPVINSHRTSITLKTRNIFIEVTSTDKVKGSIVLNQLVASFSKYSQTPYAVEPVLVKYDAPVVTPDLTRRSMRASLAYVSKLIGVKDLSCDEACKLLGKMMVVSRAIDSETFESSVPITRPDIQHPCDLAEDIAIAYGYRNIRTNISNTGTLLEKTVLLDRVKFVFTSCSYKETLMPILDSFKSSFQDMCWPMPEKNDGRAPVVVLNSQLSENETLRTSLLPGLLKSVQYKKGSNLPIRLFEVGEVVWKNLESDVGASNNTNCACAYANSTSGLEDVQGLSEYLLNKLGFISEYQVWEFNEFRKEIPDSWKIKYTLKETEDPAFLPGRCVHFVLSSDPNKKFGVMGIVHPNVLKNFHIPFPVSLFELDLTLIQKELKNK